jgi:hypothetical protein
MDAQTLSSRHLLYYPTYILGFGVIVLAVATHFLSLDLTEVFEWLGLVFGPVYLASYVVLVITTLVALSNLDDVRTGAVWLETGLQAAGGIATLALTFTLLGISLGIESLSQREISPATIQAIISDLTRHFSTAFLTTIVGLPTANALRAAVSIRWAAILSRTRPTAKAVSRFNEAISE